ncbi:MAG TPA: hypothetical protein VFE45_09675 [Coriobacteriia bacterium]|nr:hypothetical protein [Coriobacteriia bacterium]
MTILGEILSIEEVHGFTIEPIAPMHGTSGARLGMSQMLSSLMGGGAAMDGYKVTTDAHVFVVAIDNGQSCCESWGYIASDDDFGKFIGRELREVNLTDTSCMKEGIEELESLDEGGVQFVDFVTDRGVLQLAVYNGHNGYYGHGILLAKDDEILLNTTL